MDGSVFDPVRGIQIKSGAFIRPIPRKATNDEVDETNEAEGNGCKNTIPSDVNQMWGKLENISGLKLSCHMDIFTEAPNLINYLVEG